MTARGWSFEWRKFTSALELTLLEAGGSDWRVGRWTATRRPGSLSIINPGRLAVGTRIHAPGDFFNIEIDPSELGDCRFDDGQIDGGPLVALARALARLVRDGAAPVIIESLLWSLLDALRIGQVEGGSTQVARGRESSVRLRELIHARYGEALSLSQLARAAGVSRFHAVRVFRGEYGVTPFEYLTHVRLERAASALRAGTRAVDVAVQTGFADQAHLTRWFSRMFRVTPATYRRVSSTKASSGRVQARASNLVSRAPGAPSTSKSTD